MSPPDRSIFYYLFSLQAGVGPADHGDWTVQHAAYQAQPRIPPHTPIPLGHRNKRQTQTQKQKQKQKQKQRITDQPNPRMFTEIRKGGAPRA